MQINDELEVHTGLLEEFDHDLDDTGIRLGRARQRIGRVANSAKEHGEWIPVESVGWQLTVLTVQSCRVGTDHCAANPHTSDLNNCLQDVTIKSCLYMI